MKGYAYSGYRSEYLKNTNKVLNDVMRKSRKMRPNMIFQPVNVGKLDIVIQFLKTRCEIFSMNFEKEINWDSKNKFVY